MKLIFWDGTGAVLVAKRLEDGEFRWPKMQDGVMRLTAGQQRVGGFVKRCVTRLAADQRLLRLASAPRLVRHPAHRDPHLGDPAFSSLSPTAIDTSAKA